MINRIKILLTLTILPFCAYTQKTASFTGTASDEVLKSASIVRNQLFITEFLPEVISTVPKKDNSFSINIKLDQPEILTLSVIGKSWEMYVRPGDAIQFTIDEVKGPNRSVTFYGKNAGNYNLLNDLSKSLNVRDSLPRYNRYNNLLTYKKALENWSAKKEFFVKDYALKNKISPELIALVQRMIDYDYVFLLYKPLNDKSIKTDSIPENYLKEANLIRFDKDELIGLSEYRNALRAKYIFSYRNAKDGSFKTVYQNAVKATDKQTKNFLISSLIGIYAQKQESADSLALRAAINDAYKSIKDSTYLKYIKKSQVQYFTINRKLPDQVLDGTYLKAFDQTSKRTSLREVLKANEGKAIYIDLWASWCVPCRADIAKSAESKAWLSKNEVAYLYFSIDKDANQWRKASEEDNIRDNQYQIEADLSSALLKFIDIKFIPRYLLLDKKHQVASIFAPGPAVEDLPKLRNLVNEFNKTVVKFN